MQRTVQHSLLSTAAAFGGRRTVKFLLGLKDVNIQAKDDLGMTACNWARKRGHEDIVALLEDHGLRRKPV